MSEENKKEWCGFNGWQPVAQQGDCINATYIAPLDLNDGAWRKIRETISNAKPCEFYVFDADGNASLTVGDTPEQLGTIAAAEAIMIDGKIVTRQQVVELTAERDALAATVAGIKDEISDFLASLDGMMMADLSAEEIANDLEQRLSNYDAPQQHLAELRAEAGRAGFIAGALVTYLDEPLSIIESDADKYADSIRNAKNGEV